MAPRSRQAPPKVQLAIIAHQAGETNLGLASRCWGEHDALLLTPHEALELLEPGDAALARLDVRDTLDGVESGLSTLVELGRRGLTVLNPAGALLSAHDKLVTARALRHAALPHPHTRAVSPDHPPPELEFPLVVKPQFGSWRREVVACRDEQELEATLERFARRPAMPSRQSFASEVALSARTSESPNRSASRPTNSAGQSRGYWPRDRPPSPGIRSSTEIRPSAMRMRL